MILIPVGTVLASDVNGVMGRDRKARETLVPQRGLSAVEAVQRLSQRRACMHGSVFLTFGYVS